MSPQQIEALAALIASEMDKKTAGFRSAKELDQILTAFAEGAGARMKSHVTKSVSETRDRLLGKIDQLEQRIAALEGQKP